MTKIRKWRYRWQHHRRRFDVWDADGQCAGSLRWIEANEYADGRSKLRAYRGKNSLVTVVSRNPHGQTIWRIWG